MPLVINTNSAATLAANNLATSSSSLQRSLNRLSSGSKIVNPSDDAGGLAVSMKLSAAAQRQGAVLSNIGNSLSYLQTQDGALKVAGKVLDRIGELKTLASDPTKNADDLANYNAEFQALQDQLTSLGAEKFNGIALFGSATIDVATTEKGEGVISIGGADLLAAGSGPAFATFTDTFNDLSNWTNNSSGDNTATTASNYLTLTTFNPAGGTGNPSVTSNATFSGALEVNMDFIANGPLEIAIGGTTVTSLPGSTNGSLRIAVDASGNYSSYLNGSSTAYSSGSGITGSNSITLTHVRQAMTSANAHISNFSVTSTPAGGSDANSTANAASLAGLSLATVTGAIQETATLRAANGAQQSRLGFASELLTVNKANLEAAASRITDVDVAQESTQLARFNVLVQAGTSMLAQANQSPQSVLKLLG